MNGGALMIFLLGGPKFAVNASVTDCELLTVISVMFTALYHFNH